jgi:hypothetical protein
VPKSPNPGLRRKRHEHRIFTGRTYKIRTCDQRIKSTVRSQCAIGFPSVRNAPMLPNVAVFAWFLPNSPNLAMPRQCHCGGLIRQHELTGSREAWTCGACKRYEIIDRNAGQTYSEARKYGLQSATPTVVQTAGVTSRTTVLEERQHERI